MRLLRNDLFLLLNDMKMSFISIIMVIKLRRVRKKDGKVLAFRKIIPTFARKSEEHSPQKQVINT